MPPLHLKRGTSPHILLSDDRLYASLDERRRPLTFKDKNEDEIIVPFLEEPVGELDFDGHDVTVWGLACRASGEVVCLNCTGPQASVSAALQRLIKRKGRSIPFLPRHPGLWTGPTELGRMEEQYVLLRQALTGTHLKNYCLLSRASDIGAGLKRIRTLPPGLAVDGGEGGRESPSPGNGTRFVLGKVGATRPPHGSAYGHWKSIQVVCLPEWEHTLWEMGEWAGLITPLPALGLSCWQLHGEASQWRDLVKRGRTENHLPLPKTLPHSS